MKNSLSLLTAIFGLFIVSLFTSCDQDIISQKPADGTTIFTQDTTDTDKVQVSASFSGEVVSAELKNIKEDSVSLSFSGKFENGATLSFAGKVDSTGNFVGNLRFKRDSASSYVTLPATITLRDANHAHMVVGNSAGLLPHSSARKTVTGIESTIRLEFHRPGRVESIQQYLESAGEFARKDSVSSFIDSLLVKPLPKGKVLTVGSYVAHGHGKVLIVMEEPAEGAKPSNRRGFQYILSSGKIRFIHNGSTKSTGKFSGSTFTVTGQLPDAEKGINKLLTRWGIKFEAPKPPKKEDPPADEKPDGEGH